MTVTSNGSPSVVSATPGASMTATGAFPTGASPAAGDLMVAIVGLYSPGGATTATAMGAPPSGWIGCGGYFVPGSTAIQYVTYYKKIATGSDSAPAFTATIDATSATSGALTVVILDLSDSSALTPQLYVSGDGGGYNNGGVATTGSVVPSGGCLGIAACGFNNVTTAATTTWSVTSGWSVVASTTASLASHVAVATTTSAPTSGATASVTFSATGTIPSELQFAVVACPPGTLTGLVLEGGTNGPGFTSAITGSSITASFVQTVPSGLSNPLLIVYLAVGTSTTLATDNPRVSFNSVSMTRIGGVNTDNGSAGYVALFGLINPGAVSNGTTALTLTNAPDVIMMAGALFSGANQTTGWTNLTTAFGASNVATVTTTSAVTAGDICVAVLGTGTGVVDLRAGPQLRWVANLTTNTGGSNGSGSTIIGTGSTAAVTWDVDTDNWGIAIAEIQAAPVIIPPTVLAVAYPRPSNRVVTQSLATGRIGAGHS